MSLGDTLLQLLFRFIVNTVSGAYLHRSYLVLNFFYVSIIIIIIIIISIIVQSRTPDTTPSSRGAQGSL